MKGHRRKCWAAAKKLASAFANLASNAVRYTPARGQISIAWQVAADRSGILSVKDTGIGIAPEHIPRLTELFHRVDRSRARDGRHRSRARDREARVDAPPERARDHQRT